MSKHFKDKTRVYRSGMVWVVSYYWPYSGIMVEFFPTWKEAMEEACGIEKNRAWV